MLRVAILSKWHVHATDYVKQLKGFPEVSITAVWDEELERGRTFAQELGVSFEADLETLLNRSDVDGVVVTTPTKLHKDVIIAAARAGKHIFTEKVMALTLQECREIAEAVEKAGVKFCISFPKRTEPHNLFAKKIIDEGLLGDITLLRIRNAHNGAIGNWLPEHFYNEELCGGGAMMDLGAHPMYLSQWLLGKPKRITSMFNSYTDHGVEDNAVSVIEFENKAVAISETGFVSSNSPFSLELYGTKGSLLIGGAEQSIKLISDKMDSKIKGWISPAQLPEALPMPIEQWISGITKGTAIDFGINEGTTLTELMQGAYLSHREKRMVEFSEFNGEISK